MSMSMCLLSDVCCQQPMTLLCPTCARSLSETRLGPEGAQIIAAALGSNSSLEHLEYAAHQRRSPFDDYLHYRQHPMTLIGPVLPCCLPPASFFLLPFSSPILLVRDRSPCRCAQCAAEPPRRGGGKGHRAGRADQASAHDPLRHQARPDGGQLLEPRPDGRRCHPAGLRPVEELSARQAGVRSPLALTF